MKWERVFNSFIFIPKYDNLNPQDFKISSNICRFHETIPFSLDDITNISYNINSSLISSSNACNNINLNNVKSFNYIHNIKISIAIRIEYKNCSGIKMFNLSSSFGDFITSLYSNISFKIYPKLICLWTSNTNTYNLTLTYFIIDDLT